MMICVPIRQKTLSHVVGYIKKAHGEADLFEIWFDELKQDEAAVGKILQSVRQPVIYKYTGKSKNLERILKYPIDYIDIDYKTPPNIVEKIRTLKPEVKIIISFHDFEKTPGVRQLVKIAERMKKKGADIVKLATFADSISDSFRMLEALTLVSKKTKAICLCMGKAGRITRLTGHLFGNYLMYAPIDKNGKTADGQIPVPELKKLIQHVS